MCGRYSLISGAEVIAKRFGAALPAEAARVHRPRYNIAPGQGIAVVFDDRDRHERRADFFHWGLVPAWATDVNIGQRLTNARSETAADKPSFRAAMRYRRCIIPADGFFEWRRSGAHKQPWFIRMKGGAPFGMAGLWEHWFGADGSEILSCAVLTTGPNALMEPIHDRMPVILAPRDYARWLDSGVVRPDEVVDLLRPCDADAMEAWTVSSAVNNARNEGPHLIEKVAPEPPPPTENLLFPDL